MVDMGTTVLWIAALLVVTGAAVIAVDLYGKHVRDGLRDQGTS